MLGYRARPTLLEAAAWAAYVAFTALVLWRPARLTRGAGRVSAAEVTSR
jgi:high-affinity Fe2+/Pb2+ permease